MPARVLLSSCLRQHDDAVVNRELQCSGFEVLNEYQTRLVTTGQAGGLDMLGIADLGYESEISPPHRRARKGPPNRSEG